MTAAALLAKFPHCSDAFLAANADDSPTRGQTRETVLPDKGAWGTTKAFMKSGAKFEIGISTDEEKLNKTERAYLAHLRAVKYAWIGIQAVTLKLADDTRYTPDFETVDAAGVFMFHETKGFMRDDARVKLQVAARSHPWARFVLIKKNGSGWVFKDVKP